ncbi:MAG: metal-dependent hydrolase [Chlorobi bacterium]|nr:metal-dependent hydrolase [Chlorobiota bacterium]
MRLTFLGHSAFTIEYGEWSLLIDPFITGNPSAESASIKSDTLNPTHIILTHGHGDHLGDTMEIARRTGAEVIATFECANYLKANGLESVADLGIGGGRNFSFGRVKFTIAHHSSSAPDGTYMGNPAGALIDIGGKTIYHAGDTALTLDMKLLGEMYDVHVAIFPIGDNYTMDVRDAIKAVEFVDSAVAVPMHYNTFPVIQADPEEFRAGVEGLGKKAETPAPGESFFISAE